MPENEPPPSRGMLESLRRLCDSGIALLQTRVELFAVELQEQKARLVRVLVLAAVAAFLGGMAVALVTVTIVILAGETARVPVLVGLSLVYVGAAVAAF